MSKIKNYYATGNTSIGFYSLYDELLMGLKRLFILKGGPGTGKSTIIREAGQTLAQQGYDIQFFHCSSDNDSLDAVIIPALKVGIVDGTAPHTIDPTYPGVVEQIINLGAFWNREKLIAHKNRIIQLTDDISLQFHQAYQQMAEAKNFHEQKEQIYISAMDFNKADQVTAQLIEKIFPEELEEEPQKEIRQLFFGAATPKGPVNFIDNITEDISKRFIIKGRSGSGKSTMMRKIGKRAEELGLSVEYYPCGFDPGSLDMVLIPTLNTAVLDGTAPHVIDPSRKGDEVVDMFELCIDPNVEREKGHDINQLELNYKHKTKQATEYLKEAKRLHDLLEEYYIQAMDFDLVNEKQKEILNHVLQNV